MPRRTIIPRSAQPVRGRVLLLLTNLPKAMWPKRQILALYRFRWQVELVFKRLKSLLHLEQLRSKDPDLVQVYLLGKLLGVLLMERIQLRLYQSHRAEFLSPTRPLSYWRLDALLWQEVSLLIRGPLLLDRIIAWFPKLLRYLCAEPRNRPQQLARARSLFHQLSFG